MNLSGHEAQGQGFVSLSFIITLIFPLSRCLGPLMLGLSLTGCLLIMCEFSLLEEGRQCNIIL